MELKYITLGEGDISNRKLNVFSNWNNTVLNIKSRNKGALIIWLGPHGTFLPLNAGFPTVQHAGPAVHMHRQVLTATASFAVLAPWKASSKACQALSPFCLSSSLYLEFTSQSVDLDVLCSF